MKIVILDGFTENPGDLSWSRFETMGDVTVYDRTPREDTDLICRRIGDAEIVITCDISLGKEIFDTCPGISYIGLLSTGYNGIDLKAAKEHGITVCNIPTYGTDSVSQFTIALLLEICSQVGHHSEAVKAGRWEMQPDFCFFDTPLMELAGKTMGVVGFGRIGMRTAAIARGLGMRILYHDHQRRKEMEDETCQFSSMDELFRESDVIALHCPLFPETKELINRDSIKKMKDGVILLNSSRGGLICERDLADALNSGKVYAAGLDVLSEEPPKKENPLLTAKNCMITPHIAWAAKESRERLMETAADNLEAFLKGNPVNVIKID